MARTISVELEALPCAAFVTDPRTSVIVAANEKAQAIGASPASVFSRDEAPSGWSIYWTDDGAKGLTLDPMNGHPKRRFTIHSGGFGDLGRIHLLMDRVPRKEGDDRERTEQVEDTDQTLQFLATMSHEMRTPLNGILGMADLLMETGLTPNQQNFAGNIKESGTALLDLINAILDYAKLETGREVLRTETFTAGKVAEGVAEMLAPKAAAKGIEVATLIHPGVPKALCGDVAKLRQILINLLGNAVKFTEGGGVIVTVEAEDVVDGECMLAIDVIDSGAGIPQTLLPSLFEAYSRADEMEEKSIEGTGLGLAIVQQLVVKMGGTVRVESEEGAGSTFILRLPFEVEDEEPEDLDAAVTDQRIVVLTRNRVLGRALSLQLRHCGGRDISVVETRNDAAAQLAETQGGLLLCDFAFAKEAAPLCAAAARSILLLPTGARQSFDHLKQVGFDAYLTKPIRQRSFIRVLSGDDLSLTQDELERAEAEKKNAPAECQPVDILLAEDNEINAVLARAVIERGGHRLDVVSDGAAAVEAAQLKRYDIILMDMHMPRMGGLDAAKAIRAQEGGGEVPIIALTANALREDQDACFAAGMNDFLSKPFEPGTLLGLIARYAGPDASTDKTSASSAVK